MNELHELGTGWTVEGNTATRGDVVVMHYDSPHVYRAKICAPIMGTIAASEYTPIAARDALRGRIAVLLAQYDKLATFLADALAAIDAPAAPDENECECKTAVMLASVSTLDCDFELWRCEWDCERAFISYQCNAIPLTNRMSLSDAGCPADYWPENCHNRPDAVIQWFLDDFGGVTA